MNQLCAALLVMGVVVACGDGGHEGDASTQDAPADVTTNDAGTDAAGDACVLTPAEACLPCAGSNPICCEGTGSCAATAGQCVGGAGWSCQTKSDCAANAFCCATGVTVNLDKCPPSAQMSFTTTGATCQQGFCTGSFAMCTSNADCPSAVPVCVGIAVAGVTVPLGVCSQ